MKEKFKLGIKSGAAVGTVLLLAALPVYRLFIYAPKAEVAVAVEGNVERAIKGPGTVQSRFPVIISSRITAVVTDVHADHGDRVRRGKLLAQLDDRDLAARAAAARTDLDLARANYARDREVFEKGYISQAAMDAATTALRAAEAREREATAALSYSRISAPSDGVITARAIEIGHTVGPGSVLFRMVDPRALWVAARIDETVVGQVAVGQPATIELRSGGRMTGKVARIVLESDAATRELEVDVAFDAPLERFAIDQEAKVVIHAGEEHGVVIPASAVFQLGRAFGVLVVTDGRAEFRPVKTGASDGERVVVHDGPKAGEPVIHRPAGIKPGSRVRAVSSGER